MICSSVEMVNAFKRFHLIFCASVFVASAPGTSLNFDQLVEIQSMLVDDLQSGSLGESLNITITSMAMTDPIAEPVDPTGGVRATNETGGTSDVPNGTKT